MSEAAYERARLFTKELAKLIDTRIRPINNSKGYNTIVFTPVITETGLIHYKNSSTYSKTQKTIFLCSVIDHDLWLNESNSDNAYSYVRALLGAIDLIIDSKIDNHARTQLSRSVQSVLQ